MTIKINTTCKDFLRIEVLLPFQGELKTLSPAKLSNLKSNILNHGFTFPFAVWKSDGKNFIIAGHQRHAALLSLQSDGYEIPPLPYNEVKARSRKEAAQLVLADSKIYGELSLEGVKEFQRIHALTSADYSGLRISDSDLADILKSGEEQIKKLTAPPPVVNEMPLDDSPEPTEPPSDSEEPPPAPPTRVIEKRVALGDLWQLGNHRLICGDSTDPAVIERLMEGDLADAVITDPPYMTTDLGFDKTGFDIHNWVDTIGDYIIQTGYLVYTCPIELLAIAGNSHKWIKRWDGIWLKSAGVMKTHSTMRPMYQSEPYAVFGKVGVKPAQRYFIDLKKGGFTPYTRVKTNSGYRRGGKDQLARQDAGGWTADGYVTENPGERFVTNILHHPNKNRLPHADRTDHPTQKPTGLFQDFIEWTCPPVATILDPFLGSGTTLLACEATNRQCRGVELSPEYCDIILDRWERKTENKAVKVGGGA